MIESLACGTPVVAWNCGSVPEIIKDGKTGFIVDNIDSAVRALDKIADLNRYDCRKEFEEKFTARRMAEEYLHIYERITKKEILLKVV
jgi:Glycosyltransferase